MMRLAIFLALGMFLLPETASAQTPKPQPPAITPAQVINPTVLETVLPVPSIQCLYFNKADHRLFVQLSTHRGLGFVNQILDWVDHGKLKRLIKVRGQEAEIVAVDFKQEELYWTTGSLFGTGGYVQITPLVKNRTTEKIASDGMEMDTQDGNLYLLAVGAQTGITYRVTWPQDHDLGFPSAWGSICDENTILTKFKVGYLPEQLLFDSPLNTLYCVYNWELQTMDGHTIPLPNGTPPKSDGSYFVNQGFPTSVIATTDGGNKVYYIDCSSKTIFKISLADGAILAKRSLTFVPSSMAVDNKAGVIYLLHDYSRVITSIHTF